MTAPTEPRQAAVAPPALHSRGLSVSRDGRPVLHQIDFSVSPGELVTIIGPNGVGKSTLLLTLLGVLRPTDGDVMFGDAPVLRLDPRGRARMAAYVPQAIDRATGLCVRDVVAGGRYAWSAPLRPPRPEDDAAVSAAIARCGLEPLAERPLDGLSAGERQKTLIAAALAQDAPILMLDEPTTSLDPAVVQDITCLLRDLHAGGHTVVIVSHDLTLPATLGGRVIALAAGRIAADGLAAEVLTPPRLREIYGAEFVEAQASDGRRLIVPAKAWT